MLFHSSLASESFGKLPIAIALTLEYSIKLVELKTFLMEPKLQSWSLPFLCFVTFDTQEANDEDIVQ